jgi:hypothetical protein
MFFRRFFSGFMEVVSSVTTFLNLSDTPANYSGQAGKYLRVNAGESALEFATVSGGSTTPTFESVSQNLDDWDKEFYYTGDILDEIHYSLLGDLIIKSFYYNIDDMLTSIVLTGDLPPGINTTKTFTYDINNNLTEIIYS